MMLPRLFFKKFRGIEFHAVNYYDRKRHINQIVNDADTRGLFYLLPDNDRHFAGTIVIELAGISEPIFREIIGMANDFGRFAGTIGVSRYQFDLALTPFMNGDIARIYPCSIDEIRHEHQLVAVERPTLEKFDHRRHRYSSDRDYLRLLVGENVRLLI